MAGEAVGPVEVWQETYERVSALVAGLTPEQLATSVPACPDWTVHDLVAHVVGLGADVLAGDEPDDHNQAWTSAQVESRRGRAATELLSEWRHVSGPLVAWMREHGSRPLADITIHEQDLRGAVDSPGARDSDAVAIVRDRMADRFGDAVADRDPITLRGPSWSWSGGGTDAGSDTLETVVEASDFDLFRALTSRRTAEQLRSWTTAGDIEDYLDAFAALGDLPTDPLSE